MTYSTGSVISHEDYNNFVWGDPTGNNGVITSSDNINYLWGPGYADRGLNQDMASLEVPGLPGSTGSVDRKGKLTPVNATDTIEAQSWIGFFSALNRMRYYQSGTAGNLTMSPTPGQGRTISTYASVAAKLSAANSWFDDPVTTIGVETTSVSTTRTYDINQPTTAGALTGTFSCKVSWPTGDHARWFFNAGGKLKISFSGATIGSPASARSAALVSTLQGIGECYITGYDNTGFSGNDSSSNSGAGKGYWTFSTTSKQLGSNTLGAGVYSDSYITAYAKLADVTGNGANNGAVGKSIVIVFTVSSGFGSTGALPAWDTDNLDVRMGISVDIIDQTGSGSTVDKTWSNPTVSSISFPATV